MERANLLLRGAAAAGIILGGARAVETVVNNQDPNLGHAAYARNADLDFNLICTDPQGDEHPAKVDILKVEKAQGGGRDYFRFTLAGDVTNRRSHLSPDVGLGIGFADNNNLVEHTAQAKGAERTEDTISQVERIQPIEIQQGRAIPFRVEEILHEEGPSAIEVNSTGETVTFSVDSQAINNLPTSLRPFTTEGQGHGNRPTQVFNKDVCQSQVIVPTTPDDTPQAKVTPQHEITPQITKTPKLPIGFPDTGDGQNHQPLDSKEMGVLGALAGLTGASLLGAFYLKNRRR